MADRIPDDAFARYVVQHAFATAAQVDAAREFQAESARSGQPITLADAMVKMGIVTLAQQDLIGQRIQTQQKGAAAQLLHYKLVKKLGEGGMGAVYLAEDTLNDRKVALKVLPRQYSRDASFITRFQREADATGRLNHENIVRAYSAAEDQGHHFFVMEYCEGETLNKRIKRDGFLPPGEALDILLQVARALQYAHGLGILHRDIKPSNIIMAGGVVKILDLGLSKSIDGGEQSFLTQSGVAIGTPHYMSPEQARGDKQIDGRSDIYSAGAMLYHLVTGVTPFQGATALEIMTKQVNEQIADPRDVRDGIPDGLAHVIRRMMAKRPEDRYPDCEKLIADLERVKSGQDPASQALDAARSVVKPRMDRRARERFRTQRRREQLRKTRPAAPKPNPAVLVGVGAAVVLALLLLLVLGNGSEPPKPRPATAKASPPSSRIREPRVTPPAPEPASRPARTADTLRREEALRKLNEIKEQEKAGSLTPEEVRTRYEAFAKEYADTPQGKTIAELLAASAPKPVSRTPEPVKPVEPKPEPVVAKPEPKPEPVAAKPEPKPEPAAITPPPAPKPKPALPEIWKLLVANKAKLTGTAVPVKLDAPLDKAKPVVDDVTETALEMTASFGGGRAGVSRKAGDLSAEELIGLLKAAGVETTPEIENLLAALTVEQERAKAEADYARAIEAAKKLLARKDWKGAAAILEKALAIKPDDPEAARLKTEAEDHLGPAPILTLDLGGGVTMETVYIRPGAFVMGGTEDANPNSAWQGIEKPKHSVTITRGFYLGKYEVTQAQYEAVMGENPSKFKEPVHPVELVTWAKAVEFCQRLSKRTRRTVRLPTEAEWEYACRAGTTGSHSFGPDASLDDYAWHRGNAGGRTHPVGQKKPNPWGLHDMYGNVWEWVADWYGADYYEKSPRENPGGPETGTRRLLRGGSWFYDVGFRCRSAFRHHNDPERGFHTLGFRVAVSAR